MAGLAGAGWAGEPRPPAPEPASPPAPAHASHSAAFAPGRAAYTQPVIKYLQFRSQYVTGSVVEPELDFLAGA